MSERDEGKQINISLTIPNLSRMDRRSALIFGGVGLAGMLIGSRFFGVGTNSEKSIVPNLPTLVESEEEKETTASARKFLETMFLVRTLPEVTTKLFPLLHPEKQATMAPVDLLNEIREYQLCSGLGLKKSGYEDGKNREGKEKTVNFNFETAVCKGPNFGAKGIYVVFWPLKGGGYAPGSFSWIDYYPTK